MFDSLAGNINASKQKALQMLGGVSGLDDLIHADSATGLALTDEAALIPVMDEHGDTQMIALDLKSDL